MFHTTVLFFSRATLYVGKYSTSLYASLSLVHDGVTVVVSESNKEKTQCVNSIVQGCNLLCIRSLLYCSFHHLSFHATNSKCCFVQACSGSGLLASLIVCFCARAASWQHLPHAGRSWQPGDRRGQRVCHHTQHQCQVQCCTKRKKSCQLYEELSAPHR